MRIRLRNRLTFKNESQNAFLKHLDQVRKLYDNFDYKLQKKLNVYTIPKGIKPQFSAFSEFYRTEKSEYENVYKVRISNNKIFST